mgnify:CR=1 FL=1
MKKNISILIYENEFFLNSIFKEQFLNIDKFKIMLINDHKKLTEIIDRNFFDAFIINFNLSKEFFSNIIEKFETKNKHRNIIVYYDDKEKSLIPIEYNTLFLKKPFRMRTLFKKLNEFYDIKYSNLTKALMMDNVKFTPLEKTIHNIKNNKKERLTEKETNLLKFFNNNKNKKIPKIKLLNEIWGVSGDINTHTLETHIYRLKQKLNKVEPSLSFSLISQNGFYCMKYDSK